MTSPVMILDFFPEITLGDGPKKHRIRVNLLTLPYISRKQLEKDLPRRTLALICLYIMIIDKNEERQIKLVSEWLC